jgi:tripartite-type tricarboxylate transporter receptor subunit TctC
MAPAGTPPAIIDKLNAEVRKALDLPEVRKRLGELGAEPSPGSAAELRGFIASELAKWGKVVRDFGVRVD